MKRTCSNEKSYRVSLLALALSSVAFQLTCLSVGAQTVKQTQSVSRHYSRYKTPFGVPHVRVRPIAAERGYLMNATTAGRRVLNQKVVLKAPPYIPYGQ